MVESPLVEPSIPMELVPSCCVYWFELNSRVVHGSFMRMCWRLSFRVFRIFTWILFEKQEWVIPMDIPMLWVSFILYCLSLSNMNAYASIRLSVTHRGPRAVWNFIERTSLTYFDGKCLITWLFELIQIPMNLNGISNEHNLNEIKFHKHFSWNSPLWLGMANNGDYFFILLFSLTHIYLVILLTFIFILLFSLEKMPISQWLVTLLDICGVIPTLQSLILPETPHRVTILPHQVQV